MSDPDLLKIWLGHPTAEEDLAYVAWLDEQDFALPCGCWASQPDHTCMDSIPDDDNPYEERP